MRTVFDRVAAIRYTVLLASFCVFLAVIAAHTLPAQEDEGGEGVSAGGNWTQYSSEDRMTAQHRTRFELPAENLPNSDNEARIVLYCSDGKLTLADFHPGSKLARPNWPGFWGQPQLEVMVRIDDSHSYHGWNWVRDHFLSMDKGTTRGMIQSQVFNVELPTRSGRQIAEFSPAGLDVGLVRKECDLTPKKPSKD
jgi:hypothetical protein